MSSQRLTLAAFFVFLAATAAFARKPALLDDTVGAKLRQAANAHEKVSIPGVPLGRASLDTLELEPMELWAQGAKIIVHDNSGTHPVNPPNSKYFRGRVKDDPASTVFLAISDKTMHGLVVSGDKHFAFGTAKRVDKTSDATDDDTIAVREIEPSEDPSSADWKCGVESKAIGALRSLKAAATSTPRDVRSDLGNAASAKYEMRLEIETDFELWVALGGTNGLTTYIESLVGNASVVFQRDLNTTLTLGNVAVYSNPGDPWFTSPIDGTAKALGEVSTHWATDNQLTKVSRSAVVMVSGRAFLGGLAFTGTMCGPDTFCGSQGESCGSSDFANQYAGAYAFVGTDGTVVTTVPDPTATRNGITYALPATSDYWMLFLFLHEVGHLAGGPHTNCVWLTYDERAAWGVSRFFVDECSGTESKCYSGTPALPAELGTIMSNCHTQFDGNGNRGARYLFWEPGKPSSKMLGLLRLGLDQVTPDAAIRLGTPGAEDAQPLACGSHTAQVPDCANCEFLWSISGGTISGNKKSAIISYTPSAPIATLNVTVTRNASCAITVSRQVTTSCAPFGAPSSFLATANGGTNVLATWAGVNGVAKYEVSRTSNGTNWVTVGTTASTSFLDVTVVQGTVYLYRVRGLDAANFAGPYSGIDVASAFDFTDPVIAAQQTLVRATHIAELRVAVNALRAMAGLPATIFTDGSLPSMSIKRSHIEELRSSLSEAMTALGCPAVVFTDPVLTNHALVRREHVAELRAVLR